VLIIPGRLRWLWLTLGVVFLDRASKAWFESQTVEGWRYELIQNFAYFVHSRNPGIAFGVLSDSTSPWTRVLLITGSVQYYLFSGQDKYLAIARQVADWQLKNRTPADWRFPHAPPSVVNFVRKTPSVKHWPCGKSGTFCSIVSLRARHSRTPPKCCSTK